MSGLLRLVSERTPSGLTVRTKYTRLGLFLDVGFHGAGWLVGVWFTWRSCSANWPGVLATLGGVVLLRSFLELITGQFRWRIRMDASARAILWRKTGFWPWRKRRMDEGQSWALRLSPRRLQVISSLAGTASGNIVSLPVTFFDMNTVVAAVSDLREWMSKLGAPNLVALEKSSKLLAHSRTINMLTAQVALMALVMFLLSAPLTYFLHARRIPHIFQSARPVVLPALEAEPKRVLLPGGSAGFSRAPDSSPKAMDNCMFYRFDGGGRRVSVCGDIVGKATYDRPWEIRGYRKLVGIRTAYDWECEVNNARFGGLFLLMKSVGVSGNPEAMEGHETPFLEYGIDSVRGFIGKWRSSRDSTSWYTASAIHLSRPGDVTQFRFFGFDSDAEVLHELASIATSLSPE